VVSAPHCGCGNLGSIPSLDKKYFGGLHRTFRSKFLTNSSIAPFSSIELCFYLSLHTLRLFPTRKGDWLPQPSPSIAPYSSRTMFLFVSTHFAFVLHQKGRLVATTFTFVAPFFGSTYIHVSQPDGQLVSHDMTILETMDFFNAWDVGMLFIRLILNMVDFYFNKWRFTTATRIDHWWRWKKKQTVMKCAVGNEFFGLRGLSRY
jgi:hypothetical protein